MRKEAKALVKKTAKIAGVTCIAAGAVALVTTGAALKALTDGAKYLTNTIHKIIGDTAEPEVVADTVPTEAFVEEVAAAEEPASTEEPCDPV